MTDGPRELLARYHQAMLDLDPDALADLYAVDGVHVFPFLTLGHPRRYHGREEVRAGYRRTWGASTVRLDEIHDVVVYDGTDPTVVAGEWEASGTIRSTGAAVTVRGFLVLRAHGGAIVELRDYMDGLGTNHALGRLADVAAKLG